MKFNHTVITLTLLHSVAALSMSWSGVDGGLANLDEARDPEETSLVIRDKGRKGSEKDVTESDKPQGKGNDHNGKADDRKTTIKDKEPISTDDKRGKTEKTLKTNTRSKSDDRTKTEDEKTRTTPKTRVDDKSKTQGTPKSDDKKTTTDGKGKKVDGKSKTVKDSKTVTKVEDEHRGKPTELETTTTKTKSNTQNLQRTRCNPRWKGSEIARSDYAVLTAMTPE